jgi:hypothetical protein
MHTQPDVIASARVTVTVAATPFGSGALATIYGNSGRQPTAPGYAKGLPVANPFTLDASGRMPNLTGFWLAPGVYDVKYEQPVGTIVKKVTITVTETGFPEVTGYTTSTAPDGTVRMTEIIGPSITDGQLQLDAVVVP